MSVSANITKYTWYPEIYTITYIITITYDYLKYLRLPNTSKICNDVQHWNSM